MEICTSHYDENLDWLSKSPWPVSIVTHQGGAPVPSDQASVIGTWVIPNRGFEATAYLKYIIERYDSLPEAVAFIHGHEEAPHQQGGRHMFDLIHEANINKYGYVPLNNSWRCVISPSQMRNFMHRWHELLNVPMPERFVVDTGAQFVVTRERILSNTKEQYQYLFDQIESKDDATILEHVWHYIFGDKISMTPHVDYFDPPLKEILYTACTLPFLRDDIPWCYIGQHAPGGMVAIRTDDDYNYYKKRAGMFFRLTSDTSVKLTVEDPGATNVCHSYEFMNHIIRNLGEQSDAFRIIHRRI